MKKYKLINNLTKEETLCDLVTIDEFDYYVNDNEIIQKDFYIDFRSDGNYNSNGKSIISSKEAVINAINNFLIWYKTKNNVDKNN